MARIIHILLALNLCFGVFGAEVLFKGNTGGLNSKASPVAIEDNQATDLLNVNLGTDGAIEKRSGYSVLNSSALSDQVDGLWPYYQNDGTVYLMAAAAGIFKMDSFDGTWDDVTGTTSITTENQMDSIIFENVVIMTNGADKVQEWNGTGNCTDNDVNSDISLTKSKYVEGFKSRVFFGNVTVSGTDYPSRIYYSAIADRADYTATHFLRIGVDDGDEITGMLDFADRLYIFKKRSIYRVRSTGDVTIPFAVEKTYATEGCIAPFSIQVIENKVIYLSEKGLAMFDGSRSDVISYRIQPTIDSLDDNLLVKARSSVFNELNQYWLYIGDGDSGDRVIVYDYYHDAFLLHDGIEANGMTNIYDSNDSERFYTGDFNGYVYRQDQGTNDNPSKTETAINSFYETKNFDFDSFLFTKSAFHMVMFYEAQETDSDILLNYSYDLDAQDWGSEILDTKGDGAQWDVSKWDVDVWPAIGPTYHRFDLRSQGVTVRFKFSNDDLSESMKIYGWSVAYEPGGIVFNP